MKERMENKKETTMRPVGPDTHTKLKSHTDVCDPAEIQRRHHPNRRTVTQKRHKKCPQSKAKQTGTCSPAVDNVLAIALFLYSYHSLDAEDSPSSDKRASDFASLDDPSGALSSLWQKQILIVRKKKSFSFIVSYQ